MKNIHRNIVIAAAAIAIGAAVFYFSRPDDGTAQVPASAQRKVLYWYDPMVPDQHFDKPGKSPFMDMELVPKYADGEAPAGVRIDAATQQNLGVRSARVERTPLPAEASAVGSIAFDENALTVLQARADGFVQRMHVHADGESVAAGAPLVDMVVPAWAGVQQELLALRNSGDAALLAAARARALALGLSATQIAAIEKNGAAATPVFTVRAPHAGIVRTLDVRAGMNVAAGAPLATLNGIERVWLDIAIPQSSAIPLQTGDVIAVRAASSGAPTQPATIVALLPELNAATRSVRVRAQLDNRDGRWRIGEYAQAIFDTRDDASMLTVPAAAVIRGGAGDRVIALRDDGSFMPQRVTIGREAGERIEIIEGLNEGQRVISSAQFLIDSEANLSGQLQRLQNPAPAAAPPSSDPARAAGKPGAQAPRDHGAHDHD